MAIKFSLVIPTRSRAKYLRSCLEAALTAADGAGCDAEILVSDNASDDGTGDVVAAFSHPAIRYVRRSERISMRENFETCLNEITGSHVIYIGDDDAVLPNGLSVLRQVIEQTGSDIVNWTLPGYSWPDPDANEAGYLKLFPAKLSGRLRKIDADATLERLRNATFRSYHDGAVTYHGCVSKKIIDRARTASKGTYFWCSSPDVFAAMHNLMIEDVDFRKLDLPITLGGASPRSNGRSGQRMSLQDDEKSGAEFEKFIAESAHDPFNGRLPSSCPSLSLITLDALLLAASFHGRTEQIDRERWAHRIANEVAGMADQHRAACARFADEMIGLPLPVVSRRPVTPTAATPDPNKSLKSWPARIDLIGGTGMKDVANAAATLNQVCGMAIPWSAPPGILARLARTLRTAWRGRQAAIVSFQTAP